MDSKKSEKQGEEYVEPSPLPEVAFGKIVWQDGNKGKEQEIERVRLDTARMSIALDQEKCEDGKCQSADDARHNEIWRDRGMTDGEERMDKPFVLHKPELGNVICKH